MRTTSFLSFPNFKSDRRCILTVLILLGFLILYKLSGQVSVFGNENLQTDTPETTADAASTQKATMKSDSAVKSFTVQGDVFIKDGKAFSFHAGMAHYWRRPPEYWEDTMRKIRALGLNTVQTYISWNLHEPEPEMYDFQAALNIGEYFRLAQMHGLLVIVRPGPFINAEVDKGGLPYWLMRLDPAMKLRTSDPAYFQYVNRWYRKLMPIIEKFLYTNGGPIILVQIENEYGSYHACDIKYRIDLRDLTRELLGPEILLYTTDGSSSKRIACGRVKGTVTTVDFGAGAATSNILKIFRGSVPVGPFVNSEFYPGWINHWGRDWNTVPYEPVVKSTQEMLKVSASFTYYPIIGGTNFGFTVGSNIYKGVFLPGTTSYDFDAPISEAGDLTEKYWKIREVFQKAGLVPITDTPPSSSAKGKYGFVKMKYSGSIFTNLKRLCPGKPVKADYPMTFEELKHPYGFVLYRTTVQKKFQDPAQLSIPGLGDRGTVFVNKKHVGVLGRTLGLRDINIFLQPGQVLDILVQNEGRITVGDMTNDFKGITGNVTLQNITLLNWEHYPLELPSYPVRNPRPLDLQSDTEAVLSENDSNIAAFYTGTFRSSPARDVFLRLDKWHQGYAFVNGHNLGRYWPAQGPQMTLFIPGVFLKNDTENVVQLFEVSQSPCFSSVDCVVEFVDSAVLEPKTVYKHHSFDAAAVIKKQISV